MQPQLLALIVAAATALAVAGCATMGASSHVDSGFDLHGAVEKQLAARGYERPASTEAGTLIFARLPVRHLSGGRRYLARTN